MRDLSESEKQAIRETVAPLEKNRGILGLCVYGSQVAGYATPSSDYDVILVLKHFPQRIKYYYLKGKVDCSVLAVDSKSFDNDCKKSSLGEFAAGRLLNSFALIDGDRAYFENDEIAYKRRVILEGLSGVYAQFLDFSSQIEYPLSFFLFDKLRKRAAIYPPVVYSYFKTYSPELLEDNLKTSLQGFSKAARLLESEGLVVETMDGYLRVTTKGFRVGISARFESAAKYTTKSLAQYAVHGYAGRVAPKVVGREVVSKISRSRHSKSKLPDEIMNPRRDWRLPEGRLFADSSDWLSDLVQLFEMDYSNCIVSAKAMGEIYTSAGFYTLEDPSSKGSGVSKRELAVKHFHDFKSMKWGILSLWSLKNTNFTLNALERLTREYRASRDIRRFGLETPQIIAVFLSHKIIVTSYIHGEDLSKVESRYLNGETEDIRPVFQYGSDLARMHNNNYCMGDTKPSNAIWSSNDSSHRLYFVDLEQAHPGGNKTWDIAEFIYYSVRFTLKEDRARRLVDAFVQGYLEKAEDKTAMDDAGSLRYRMPFQAFIAPNVMSALRNDLNRLKN